MPPKKRQKSRNRPPAKAAAVAKPPARSVRLSPNMKFTAGLIGLVLVIVGIIWWSNRDEPAAAAEQLVRANSHKLSAAADGKVTLVEFLDFECPSCAAAYPSVEKIRTEYAGRITYVVRLFPLTGHKNAIPAASAAQAAANQGKFEAMYKKLFESQGSWGGKETDQAATFEQYATELGLDMTRYKADVAAQATSSFITAEVADAKAVKVTGTPTFFLNGKKMTTTPTYDNLKKAIDEALAS